MAPPRQVLIVVGWIDSPKKDSQARRAAFLATGLRPRRLPRISDCVM
jgi:hypothetical protein